MAEEKVTSLATPALSAGREERFDGRARIRFHRLSKRSFLLGTALSWLHAVGVLPILCEIRSCYRRILLRRKIGSLLSPEAVRRSIPPMGLSSGSPSRIGTQICIEGIQALSKERPWLTLPDIELFLQGWFRAEGCVRGNVGIAEGTLEPSFSPSTKAVPESPKHGRSAPPASRE